MIGLVKIKIHGHVENVAAFLEYSLDLLPGYIFSIILIN